MKCKSADPRRGLKFSPSRIRGRFARALPVMLALLVALLLLGACSGDDEAATEAATTTTTEETEEDTTGAESTDSTRTPVADLRVSLEAVAHDETAGTWVLYRITNAGDADATAFDLDLFANRDEPPEMGTFGDVYAVYAGLDAGASFLDFVQIPEQDGASGTAYASVDTSAFVEESEEENNISAALGWGDVEEPLQTLDFEDGEQPEGIASVNSAEDTDLNWGFDTENPAGSGTTSLVSGPVGDDQWTCLAYDPGEATERLAFSRRISSEPEFDGMTLFMDDELVFFWSGEVEWGRFTLSMPSQARTYTFCYVKDEDQLEGEDAVWVDLVEVQ